MYEAFGETTHFLSKMECGMLPKLCDLAVDLIESSTTEFDDPDRL